MKTFLKTILFFLILTSCNSSKKMNSQQEKIQEPVTLNNNFDKQGHRGCRGLMPENTIPAMLYAIGMGVTTLEMDVVITKDGKVILSHEPFFNHEITTKPDGSFVEEKEEKALNIFQMDYAVVQTYDVGMKQHPRFLQQEKLKAVKPLLADVFEAVKQDMMTRRRPFPFYNIETKTAEATDNIYHPKPAEFVEALMKVIKENQMEDFVIIQSFDIRTLVYLQTHYPAILTALLIDEGEGKTISEKITQMKFMPAILSPHFSIVSPALIKEWHAQNRKIIPWTVNDKKEIERLRSLGVDGIITDYPNLFNE